jgi:Response regulator containing a CheY-like receiver domain and an HTH DNA-binding domain
MIIDDDKEFLAVALDFLIVQMNLNNVVWAVSPEEAEEKIRIYNPKVVILDLGMKKLRGKEISSIINKNINSPVIIMTSIYDNNDYLELTHELGGDGFFRKDLFKTALPKLMEFIHSDNQNDDPNKDIFRDKSFLLN